MEVRRIILPAIAALLLLVVVVLYIKVNGSSAASVDPEALERAKSEHDRAERRAAVASAPTAPSTETASRMTVRPPPPAIEETPEPEEIAPTPQPRRIMPGTRSLRSRDPDKGTPNELRDQLKEVRILYDRGRYPEAREAALEMLKEHPENRRMLRVVVSASCIMAEPEPAREYYPKLPERDKRTMRKRCAKYGIEDLE